MTGERDLRSALEAGRREAACKRAAEQRAAETAAKTARATLGALLMAYVAQLRRDGKRARAMWKPH